jgi:hypothetical protein
MKGLRMTRIIEHRHEANPGDEVFELRIFKSHEGGGVRGCVVPADVTLGHDMMEEISEPAPQAFLDALALCEKEQISVLWVHDPYGLFPPHARPVRWRP